MTIKDLDIESTTEFTSSPKQVLDEIKNMLHCALSSSQKWLASGAVIMSLMSLSASPESFVANVDTPQVDITLSSPQPIENPTISIASQSANQIKLAQKLNQLQALEKGWDGMNALKPHNKAIRQASMLISQLNDEILRFCTLFPSNDAGIYLQGKLPKGRLSIFMNGEVMAYIVKGASSKLSAIVDTNPTTINYLNQGILMYV